MVLRNWLAAIVASVALAAALPAVADAALVGFKFTGAPAPFIVPAGVHELTILATGGRGGGSTGAPGGWPAQITGEAPVTPGERLSVIVGGNGALNKAGYNGGGGASGGGYGGGGASGLLRCAAPDCLATASNYLILAAGGGGAGGDGRSDGTFPGTGSKPLVGGSGGASGQPGSDPPDSPGTHGGPATATAGGMAGAANGTGGGGGLAGAAFVGGVGGPPSPSGGAGGGGGGGGLWGGGGGGGGYDTPAGFFIVNDPGAGGGGGWSIRAPVDRGGANVDTSIPFVLISYSAPTDRRCVVPKLRSRSLKSAKTRIKNAGCKLGKVKRPKHRRKHRRLVVVRQSPKAGTNAPASTKVNLSLAYKR